MRIVFFALLLAASCGDPRIIDGKSYSTQCSVAADCVGVFFGNQCEACGCPNAAIATSARITYEADRSSAIATCGAREAIACAACQEKPVACTAGVCGL